MNQPRDHYLRFLPEKIIVAAMPMHITTVAIARMADEKATPAWSVLKYLNLYT
jgi:hypothetical protein